MLNKLKKFSFKRLIPARIKRKLNLLDEHTLEVVRKSSASMVVKVFGMIAGVFVSILLGRTLGPDGLGVINLINRIISLLLVFIMLVMSFITIKIENAFK